jgi:hypothetical protein
LSESGYPGLKDEEDKNQKNCLNCDSCDYMMKMISLIKAFHHSLFTIHYSPLNLAGITGCQELKDFMNFQIRNLQKTFLVFKIKDIILISINHSSDSFLIPDSNP